MLNDTSSWLGDLWRYLQQPEVLWQAGALLLCLSLAFLVDRAVRGRIEQGAAASAASIWRFGRGGLKRITFPLVALLLVLLARALLRHWTAVNLLSHAVP